MSDVTNPMFNYYSKICYNLYGTSNFDGLMTLALEYLDPDLLKKEIFKLKKEINPTVPVEGFDDLVLRRFVISCFLMTKNSLRKDDETTAKITVVTVLAFNQQFHKFHPPLHLRQSLEILSVFMTNLEVSQANALWNFVEKYQVDFDFFRASLKAKTEYNDVFNIIQDLKVRKQTLDEIIRELVRYAPGPLLLNQHISIDQNCGASHLFHYKNQCIQFPGNGNGKSFRIRAQQLTPLNIGSSDNIQQSKLLNPKYFEQLDIIQASSEDIDELEIKFNRVLRKGLLKEYVLIETELEVLVVYSNSSLEPIKDLDGLVI